MRTYARNIVEYRCALCSAVSLIRGAGYAVSHAEVADGGSGEIQICESEVFSVSLELLGMKADHRKCIGVGIIAVHSVAVQIKPGTAPMSAVENLPGLRILIFGEYTYLWRVMSKG